LTAVVLTAAVLAAVLTAAVVLASAVLAVTLAAVTAAGLLRGDALAAGEPAEVALLAAGALDVDVDAVQGGPALVLQRTEDGVVDVARVARLRLTRLGEARVRLRDLAVEAGQFTRDTPARLA